MFGFLTREWTSAVEATLGITAFFSIYEYNSTFKRRKEGVCKDILNDKCIGF